MSLTVDLYIRRFMLSWLCITGVDYNQVKHLKVKDDPSSGWLVTSCYDGTEICAASGTEMLRIFSLAMSHD
jgi:hypothetical protein